MINKTGEAFSMENISFPNALLPRMNSWVSVS